MNSFFRRLAILSLLSISLFSSSTLATTVLAIDYGSDFIKASLIKPGAPFDVLLDKDSKRKIRSSVAWKNGERLFGQDAFNLATRFPKDSYSSLKYLLGVPANADVIPYYNSFAPLAVVPSTRFTAAIRKGSSSSSRGAGEKNGAAPATWDVEELVAMQLAYVRALAVDVAGRGERVQDVVVTVPAFFSQFERDAIADAVELAGLRLLALVNDGAAVAINYAMTRQFPQPERHIVYDAGAASTRATVATFAGQGKKQDATVITVNGIGYDRLAGGTELDRRLREVLVEEFEHKHGVGIRDDPKAMMKLWKEAERLKAILSANTEASSRVESVFNDIDFSTKVTRQGFENICADMNLRFVQPIYDALDNANLSLADIDSVILTGGASRIPMVRAALAAAVGEEKLAMNVNSDEAAVLGAALHGATLSRQFRTKNIKISDIAPYDVQVSYLAEAKSTDASGASPRTITSLAFAKGSRTGTRKTLTFRRKNDFSLAFSYKEPPGSEVPVELLDVRISGVAEVLANITEAGGVDPVIKATILFSDSGFVSVPEAIAFAEIKDDSLAGKLKGLFGDGSSSAEDGSTSTVDPSVSSSAPKAAKTPATPKDLTIPLNVTVKFPSVAPMGLEQKREARQRLIKMEAEEASIAAREEQRNILEGYMYKIRDLLESDSQHPFVRHSQESERRALSRELKDVSSWFHSRADDAQTKDFVEKRTSLEALERPIVHRIKELEEFPQALNVSQMWNWHARLFLGEARENLTAEERAGTTGRFAKTELDELEKALREHETWLNEWVEKQKAMPMNYDPVIETGEMRKRAKELETHLQRLVQKKPPRVRPSGGGGNSRTIQVPLHTDEAGKSEGESPSERTSRHEEL
ncbi:Hsp70 protein-domain-containing protein [Russula earlei]|uniref:Hsp70 protein-domain-containing protein n=1 Tax=Russula earlei TaxID=71964 RepID=A0ACC0U5V7_9AGAM|nr:Hsp70 protein-domain-containing protein [Russula earlei]